MLGRLLFAIGAGGALGACGAKTSAEPADPIEDDLTVAAGAAGSAAGSGGGSGGGSAMPTEDRTPSPAAASCSFGVAETFCVDRIRMMQLARDGAGQIPREPPRSSAEVEAGFLENGCLRHDWVASSCCNAALGPGVPAGGGECCYQSCEGSCCGRALVLNERTLVSAAEQRNDWLVIDATLTGLPHAVRPSASAAERARLAELWQADALMEHASIASFARFSLQLLALGAPAQLVGDAQAAGLDEVAHAERAFSIASRLAGRAIGPGKLPELDHPLELDLLSVARATLAEGCIGETFAAVVAQEQARLAGDSSVRQALLDVAEDETRHAQLAFRFLAWALAQGGPKQRANLRAELRREAERKLALLPEPSSTAELSQPALHHYGRLSSDEQRELYRQAREQILRPAFAALLEGAGAAQSDRAPSASLEHRA